MRPRPPFGALLLGALLAAAGPAQAQQPPAPRRAPPRLTADKAVAEVGSVFTFTVPGLPRATGVAFRFHFGDTDTPVGSSVPAAQHWYRRPGTYRVWAEAVLNAATTLMRPRPLATDTVEVTVRDAALAVTPASAHPGESVTASIQVQDPSAVLQFRFRFGDSSEWSSWGAAPTAAHTYPAAGTYPVVGQVGNDSESLSTTPPIAVTIAEAPRDRLGLHAIPMTAAPGQVVRFTATTGWKHDGLRLEFHFGDGTPPSVGGAREARHAFPEPGVYSTHVEGQDAAGALVSSAPVRVTVRAARALPLALILDRRNAAPGDAVELTAHAPGAPPGTRYRFDFGDGTVSGWSGSAVQRHVYRRLGAYTATVAASHAGVRFAPAVGATLYVLPPWPVLALIAGILAIGAWHLVPYPRVSATALIRALGQGVPGGAPVGIEFEVCLSAPRQPGTRIAPPDRELILEERTGDA